MPTSKTDYSVGDILRASYNGTTRYQGRVISKFETFDGDHSYLIEYAPMRHTYINNWNYTLCCIQPVLRKQDRRFMRAELDRKFAQAFLFEYRQQLLDQLECMQELKMTKTARYDETYAAAKDCMFRLWFIQDLPASVVKVDPVVNVYERL